MELINNCKTKNYVLYFIFILIIIISGGTVAKYVSALPPLPTEFYGRIIDYNSNASPGEVVYAYDNDGVLCGSFSVVNRGFYGSLTCKGDDPETAEDEGATAGENITFRYKTGYTSVIGDNIMEYGKFKYVNLSYPIVFCGDNFCDYLYENGITCPEDCPTYNASYNYTTNASNTTGTGGGTGGGSTGAGTGGGEGQTSSGATSSGSLGYSPSSYLDFAGFNLSGFEGMDFYCRENWVCGNWSKCGIDGFQNRTCNDLNDCGSFDDKPPEIQKCVYTPTCSDGVRNGLEEGIDCGGLCTPCITCFDNIQNCHDGLCEEGVDCGGPCSPCPTCFDGKQNCHDGMCEEGADCGGPCDIQCPEVQLPLGKFECKKDFNPLSNQSIIFFIIMLSLIIGDIIYSRRKIKEIGKNKKISDIERAKAILSTKRRMYLFVIIIFLISIILYLYYYFFIMCEVSYRFLWILLILLFASPLIIHQVIRYVEYTEKKRLKKLESLLNTHYKQIENLIHIENENLSEIEEELANELYRILEKPEYIAKQGTEEINILNEIYKELVSIYSKYKEKENPLSDEKILCQDIYKILEDPSYTVVYQKYSDFKRIAIKLKLLYKQYEEKQKLYDEMNKIEKSKAELHKETSDKDKERNKKIK